MGASVLIVSVAAVSRWITVRRVEHIEQGIVNFLASFVRVYRRIAVLQEVLQYPGRISFDDLFIIPFKARQSAA